MSNETEKQTGIIAWFANNSVAANLLMGFLLVMGVISYFTIQRQMFPNIEINYIDVTAVYPGASPQEIEESILIKIEEAIKDVTEIKKTISRANRGSGNVSLEIKTDKELTDVLDKVKLKVDAIASFPAEMEPVTVSQVEFQQQVVELALVGDIPVETLKPLAKQIEDELLQLSNVSLVNVGSPHDEIAIEVHPEQLRKYDLTIQDITRAIQNYSANISAGQLRTDSGIVSVRVENQFYHGEEFRHIPIKVGPHGGKIVLQDVATIKDGFMEGENYFSFSGTNAIYIAIKATKDQNMVPVAQSVKAYVAERNENLPAGISLEILVDMTYYLNARLDMMLKNLLQGAVLVAIMLTLFLRFRLAFWVMVGLPVCFLGAVLMMPVLGVSINILSLFAFIMVLGIVVDDAIVIGESAYTEIEKKGGGVENVVRGAKRVATPATFGVLTTIAVFAPFMFSSGPDGVFFKVISSVVILCLVFSLIESKLILPSHIAHTTFKPINPNSWRANFNKRFFDFVNGPYRRFVIFCTEWRWTVFMSFVAIMLLSAAMLMANHVRMVPRPAVPHDYPSITIEMNENVSDEAVVKTLKTVEGVLNSVDKRIESEYGHKMIQNLFAFNGKRTSGTIVVTLVPEELRPFDAFVLSRYWREAMPALPGMKSFYIKDNVTGGESDEFGYLLFGSDIATLNAAGRQFISMLQDEEGLFDVSSSIDPASKEIQLELLPVAYELGLDLASIGRQVGNSFFGGEAQRVIRDGEEVRVMVRYPRMSRERFAELKYTVIKTPTGSEVMLGDVAVLREEPGISYIRREGGYRSVYVYGAIDEQLVEPGEVTKTIEDKLLPQLNEMYPSVTTELGGSIKETQDQQNEQMLFGVAGLLMVYILLAVPLKSYLQPFIILSVIPFSFAGAIWGHFFFGLDISMMSTFGLIAAAGVVINDSLVMTDFVNQHRKAGYSIRESVIEAGCARFRAITLTSITTFMGVLPLMFEASLQAKFVIPMAIALGFSVLFATLVTLLLVPSMYIMLEDLKWLVGTAYGKVKGGVSRVKGRSVSDDGNGVQSAGSEGL